MLRGYRFADEEDAEDEAILRQFDSLGIEQPSRSSQRARFQRRRRLVIYVMAGAAAVALVALVVTLSVQAAVSRSEGRYWDCPAGAVPARTPGTVNFFVIGDWGRAGISPQKKVAKMMATVADCMPPAFIISTGDNFYSHGLRSPDDSQVEKSFTNVYSDARLQVPWYAVLGNHDYGDGIDPEKTSDCAANSLSDCPAGCCYSPLWQHTGRLNDARWHLQNGSYAVPTGARQLVDIFMVDTNPFITRYRDEPWFNNAGGLWQQNPDTTKAQLRNYLANSGAAWKFVVGHHPIASFGSHCKFKMSGDCERMSWLEPELQAAKVAAYLSGHDHNLQHIVKLSDPENDSSTPLWPQYVVSGAGSETRQDEKEKYNAKEGYSLEYMTDDPGFVAVQVNTTHMSVYFYAESRSTPSHSIVLRAPAVRAAQPPSEPLPVPRQGMATPVQATIRPVQPTAAVQPQPATGPAHAAAAAAAAAAQQAPAAPPQAVQPAAAAAASATASAGPARPAAVAPQTRPLGPPDRPQAAVASASASATGTGAAVAEASAATLPIAG